jgi:hypothetical protein
MMLETWEIIYDILLFLNWFDFQKYFWGADFPKNDWNINKLCVSPPARHASSRYNYRISNTIIQFNIKNPIKNEIKIPQTPQDKNPPYTK